MQCGPPEIRRSLLLELEQVGDHHGDERRSTGERDRFPTVVEHQGGAPVRRRARRQRCDDQQREPNPEEAQDPEGVVFRYLDGPGEACTQHTVARAAGWAAWLLDLGRQSNLPGLRRRGRRGACRGRATGDTLDTGIGAAAAHDRFLVRARDYHQPCVEHRSSVRKRPRPDAVRARAQPPTADAAPQPNTVPTGSPRNAEAHDAPAVRRDLEDHELDERRSREHEDEHRPAAALRALAGHPVPGQVQPVDLRRAGGARGRSRGGIPSAAAGGVRASAGTRSRRAASSTGR